jgi:hypothetical protein
MRWPDKWPVRQVADDFFGIFLYQDKKVHKE